MEMTLDRLCPGREATVIRIATKEALRRRLADFGLIPGTTVQCHYRSPYADVAAIAFRGSVLALRTRDLQNMTGETDC